MRYFTSVVIYFTCVCGLLAADSPALIVSAAASLKDPLGEIAKNGAVTFNFGGSGALQQQIENGAPVDVFISAAKRQMDALEQAGLLAPGTRRDLLRNEMVLIAPAASHLEKFADLLQPSVKIIAVGEPKSVPAGLYAQEVFTALKMSAALAPKLVFAVDVRQVLTYVESGNADAGMVYVTDAKSSGKVKIVATAPAATHEPIVYVVAVLKNAPHPAAAETFVKQLSSAESAAIFERYGFSVPR